MSSSSIVSSEELDAFLASYVGMQGNPGAPIWLCDVSPHANSTRLVTPLEPLRTPAVWDSNFRQRNRDDMSRWLNHQKAARIMASAYRTAHDVAESDWKDYFWDQLYAPSGGDFWLSLFPLPARSGASRCWSATHRGQPALNPQNRYIDLCRVGGRFRYLAELRQRMAPKIIVCFGPRHADDFLHAFGFTGTASSEVVLQPADLPKRLHIFTQGDATLVVAPLLGGAAGLNSDVLQYALGQYIGELLKG
ncbi:transcriptional regulator [Cupriavidus pauculus]|uniref:transcriptional regulator n=1 Tax=Cupriavidus pauculus TaxID=82633 RepID=UPI00124553D0|nr:transcriptional regulator [Cupriavidus pauculus]KAB0603308.1 transcriptional regulator [Cupriavidus pauculus]UAK98494.1 transcriptional regulator [Cupriavidus pauculus]